MKRRISIIVPLLILAVAACNRHKGEFMLSGSVETECDTIIVIGFDSNFDRTDTIICSNGTFTWSFYPDTVTTLLLLLPDGRHHPVFAEKDVKAEIAIPSDSGLITVSGGYCNDSYQAFYTASLSDTAIEQSIARIDSFIVSDPFSEVTPYLIYDKLVQEHHAPQETIERIIGRMSGNMQDAPYLTSLKSEFKGELPSNAYISTLTLWDTAGVKVQFADMGGRDNYLLVCVWASWSDAIGMKARRAMDSLYVKYSNRKLTIADISIDVNRERWKEAVLQDSLPWNSYIDTEGWNSRIIRSSNTDAVPVYILFTEVKKVSYVTHSIEELDKRLNSQVPVKRDVKTTTNNKKNSSSKSVRSSRVSALEDSHKSTKTKLIQKQ